MSPAPNDPLSPASPPTDETGAADATGADATGADATGAADETGPAEVIEPIDPIVQEIEVVPPVVVLGGQSVKVEFQVYLTEPAAVRAGLLGPDGQATDLALQPRDDSDGAAADSVWSGARVFQPDALTGRWRLVIELGGNQVEQEFQVRRDWLRAPVRITTNLSSGGIDLGEAIEVTGTVEREVKHVWEPFGHQIVSLNYLTDVRGESYSLGQVDTGADGRFSALVEPIASGLLWAELELTAQPGPGTRSVAAHITVNDPDIGGDRAYYRSRTFRWPGDGWLRHTVEIEVGPEGSAARRKATGRIAVYHSKGKTKPRPGDPGTYAPIRNSQDGKGGDTGGGRYSVQTRRPGRGFYWRIVYYDTANRRRNASSWMKDPT
ncbi:hypothetical protein B0I32_11682 [Nonomuraea fuscirosea]|uniref:Uncharacterized protein n=1 Tax=Nonomuraea fuscirosea TaxID=1291556 RepID=A0A2T0MR09_9ACTN|nr:hypothetical protein [Nonomuraea fuscirosea]PRX60691.1 hypothetical protein B0I32_11682 [Nonomuraea fuscirosea]